MAVTYVISEYQSRSNTMKKEEHLPIYGPGPVIGGVMIMTTAAACFLRNADFLHSGSVNGSLTQVSKNSPILFRWRDELQ